MIRVFETSRGLVAFKDWESYTSEGLLTGAMGYVSKETGAKMVILTGEAVDLSTMDLALAEELVAMTYAGMHP